MLVTLRISKAGVTALAAVILVTGCNSGSKQTEAKLEEMQIISRCSGAGDKVYLVYLGTLRALPGSPSGN